MRYEIRAVLSMLAVVALLSECKQTSREEAEPAPAATPAATAAPSATAAAEPTPAPAESINIPPPVQPNVPAAVPAPSGSATAKKAGGGESVKTCCAALRKESETNANKAMYTTAASTCDAIDKLVTAGTTKKAAALTQIRASLRGAKLPPGCE